MNLRPKPAIRKIPDTIDAFIHSRLAGTGLTKSSEASQRQLIRRAFFVLHGLPPSVQEVEDFVANTDRKAWQRLTETLLASDHYGERMATFWLDLVRFGETHGLNWH